MSEQKKTTFNITGMTCAACANRIEKNLNKMDDVEANVNVTTEKATIIYNPSSTSSTDLSNTIEKSGYGVLNEKVDLDVTGMTCAACSNRIEKVLNRTDGVEEANVNLTTENATILYNPNSTSVDTLIQKIQKLGYDAQPKKEADEKTITQSNRVKT